MKGQKKEIRAFELMKGLYIDGSNYQDFADCYDKALGSTKKSFLFRNHQGKLYQIRTEFVTFVLKLLSESNHEDLMRSANEYKKAEEKLTKEEFEKKRKQLRDDHLEAERLRSRRPNLVSLDKQVMNKPTLAQMRAEEKAKLKPKKTAEVKPEKVKNKKKKNTKK